MKVYAVYMHDHSGEDVVEVFSTEANAKHYIQDDIREVTDILMDDGYEVIEVIRSNCDFRVTAANGEIFYEWALFECTMR